ncbi:12464_t:CDS:2, partial [Gigaspora rosea]
AFGSLIAFNSLSTYLVDICLSFSASVVALINCLRLTIAGINAMICSLLENAIGTGWFFTIITNIGRFQEICECHAYFTSKESKIFGELNIRPYDR